MPFLHLENNQSRQYHALRRIIMSAMVFLAGLLLPVILAALLRPEHPASIVILRHFTAQNMAQGRLKRLAKDAVLSQGGQPRGRLAAGTLLLYSQPPDISQDGTGKEYFHLVLECETDVQQMGRKSPECHPFHPNRTLLARGARIAS